jgi:hypothetical protein
MNNAASSKNVRCSMGFVPQYFFNPMIQTFTAQETKGFPPKGY